MVFLAIERRQSDPRDSDQVFASNFAFFKHKLDALDGCNIGNLMVRVNNENIDFAQKLGSSCFESFNTYVDCLILLILGTKG